MYVCFWMVIEAFSLAAMAAMLIEGVSSCSSGSVMESLSVVVSVVGELFSLDEWVYWGNSGCVSRSMGCGSSESDVGVCFGCNLLRVGMISLLFRLGNVSVCVFVGWLFVGGVVMFVSSNVLDGLI